MGDKTLSLITAVQVCPVIIPEFKLFLRFRIILIHFLHYTYIRYKEIGGRDDLHSVYAVIYKFYLVFDLPGAQAFQSQFLIFFLPVCLGIAHQDLLPVQTLICSHDPVVILHRHHHDLTDIFIFCIRKLSVLCIVQDHLISLRHTGHYQLSVMKDIFFLNPIFFQSPGYDLLDLIYNAIVQRRSIHHQISGIPAAKAVLCSQEQAYGTGHHDQDHGGKDTDGSQAGAVSLHTEHHGRQRYEMICLIIIILVLLQYFAQSNRPCHKKQVGGSDHHEHCHKKQPYNGNRLFCGH